MYVSCINRVFIATILVLLVDYGHGQCGTSSLTATTSLQELTSPYYPSSYTNNLNCEWTISTSSDRLLLYIDVMLIENWYDRLYIYDSTGYKFFDSDYLSSPIVHGYAYSHPFRVVFSTDYSVVYQGFRMNYIGISDIVVCGSTLTATVSQKQLTYITSLAGSCRTFTITSSNRIQITTVMVLDYVRVTDASSGNSVDIHSVGSTYVSAGSSITVTSYDDFIINYEEVSSGSNNFVTTASVTSPYHQCRSGMAALTATSTLQYLESLNYPGPYNNNYYCSVEIQAENAGDSVQIHVEASSFQYGDYVTIYDAPTYSPYAITNLNALQAFHSSGRSVFITVATNSYGQNQGFQYRFQSTTRPTPQSLCDVTLDEVHYASSSWRTLTSTNYPSNYPNDDYKAWMIIKPNYNDTLVLDFTSVNIENALDCQFDSVVVYNGYKTDHPELANICGTSKITIQDSSGLHVLVVFSTDGSVTQKGFSLRYYIGEYQDPDTDASTEETPSIVSYAVGSIVGVMFLIVIIVFICAVVKHKKRVVAPRTSTAPPKPKIQKRTTQQLLTELNSLHVAKQSFNKQKIPRKGAGKHPKPNTTGPGVNVISMGHPSPVPPPPFSQLKINPRPVPPPQPQPPPPPGGFNHDPVYPPQYLGPGPNQPPGNIAPVYTNIPQATPVPSSGPFVPSPFYYVTPGEARNSGTMP